MEKLIDLTHRRPRAIFNLPAQPDTYVEVDPDAEWVLPEQGWFTKVGWSPFAGMRVRGRVVRTVVRGQTAFEEGRVLALPGTGRNVRDAALH